MQPTISFFVVLAALCLVTFALADPAKPNPPVTYTLSAMAITSKGFSAYRTYYDQPNMRARTDYLDNNFNFVGEFLGLWNANKGYWYDDAGNCHSFLLNQAWVNSWDFLNSAVYGGVYTYYSDMKCNMWLNPLNDGLTMVTCFSNDAPVFISMVNGTESWNELYFITSFSSSVDTGKFAVPFMCTGSVEASLPMKNFKKHQIPTHPLLP